MASNYLHCCIKQKLEDVIEGITEDNPPMHLSGQCICQNDPLFVEEKKIQQENVVIGALESAFQECVSDPTFFFIIVPRIELCCALWETRNANDVVT